MKLNGPLHSVFVNMLALCQGDVVNLCYCDISSFTSYIVHSCVVFSPVWSIYICSDVPVIAVFAPIYSVNYLCVVFLYNTLATRCIPASWTAVSLNSCCATTGDVTFSPSWEGKQTQIWLVGKGEYIHYVVSAMCKGTCQKCILCMEYTDDIGSAVSKSYKLFLKYSGEGTSYL